VIVSGVDESQVTEPDPATLAARLAELKAEAVLARVVAGEAASDADVLVLGCDSVLELDGRILGKPDDADDARERWRSMRGRSGVLHTGHCLCDVASGRRIVRSVDTVVHFADVTDDEVEAYVATGEPLHVAGAFTIDGLGGAFVRAIEGDPHCVVGVSLPALREMVIDLGHGWTDLWSAPR
jgi:septum formation protein